MIIPLKITPDDPYLNRLGNSLLQLYGKQYELLRGVPKVPLDTVRHGIALHWEAQPSAVPEGWLEATLSLNGEGVHPIYPYQPVDRIHRQLEELYALFLPPRDASTAACQRSVFLSLHPEEAVPLAREGETNDLHAGRTLVLDLSEPMRIDARCNRGGSDKTVEEKSLLNGSEATSGEAPGWDDVLFAATRGLDGKEALQVLRNAAVREEAHPWRIRRGKRREDLYWMSDAQWRWVLHHAARCGWKRIFVFDGNWSRGLQRQSLEWADEIYLLYFEQQDSLDALERRIDRLHDDALADRVSLRGDLHLLPVASIASSTLEWMYRTGIPICTMEEVRQGIATTLRERIA